MVDPFGNILGVMSNPHYLAVLDTTAHGDDGHRRGGDQAVRYAEASGPGCGSTRTRRWVCGWPSRSSRAPAVTYAEALEVALAYGWIDGLTPPPAGRRSLRTAISPPSAAEPVVGAQLPPRRSDHRGPERMAPRGLAEVERARADGRWRNLAVVRCTLPGVSMHEGYIPFRDWQTWYRIVGEREEPRASSHC